MASIGGSTSLTGGRNSAPKTLLKQGRNLFSLSLPTRSLRSGEYTREARSLSIYGTLESYDSRAFEQSA
jgi:hypothetical protein